MISKEEYLEKNHKSIREAYEEMLSDQGYYGDLSEIDDGRQERQDEEYKIYLVNNNHALNR